MSNPVLTPCIGICELDADGLCTGCQRNTDEIGRWSLMNDTERLQLMEQVLPARESRRR